MKQKAITLVSTKEWFQRATVPDKTACYETMDMWREYMQVPGAYHKIQKFSRRAQMFGAVRSLQKGTNRSMLSGFRMVPYVEPAPGEEIPVRDPDPVKSEPKPKNPRKRRLPEWLTEPPDDTPLMPGVIEDGHPLLVVADDALEMQHTASELFSSILGQETTHWGYPMDPRRVCWTMTPKGKVDRDRRDVQSVQMSMGDQVPQKALWIIHGYPYRPRRAGLILWFHALAGHATVEKLTWLAHLTKSRLARVTPPRGIEIHGIPSSPTDVPQWCK
jgi:hypothetical protein